MAEFSVFSLASNVLSAVASPALKAAYEKGCSIWDAKDDLDKLRVTIGTIHARLLDAEKKQEGSAEVTDWIKRVKVVLYDADDLFDDVATDDMLNRLINSKVSNAENKQGGSEGSESSNGMKNWIKAGNEHLEKVRVFFSNQNPVVSNNSIANRVKAIRKTLLEISTDMEGFRFVQSLPDQPVSTIREGVQDPGWFVDSCDVIGRDEDKKAILEMLAYDVEKDVSVIAVVGIGGMGKSTLAQLVYNDEEVERMFAERWFACISNTVDKNEVVGKIIQSMCDRESYSGFTVGQLQTKIRRFAVEGKKFLLVLDDVWDDNRGNWIDLLGLLGGGAKGSKIIVTTRLLTVAGVMGASETTTHNLDGLHEDDSWKLFKRIAFTPEQEKDLRRIDLGRKIMKKCANLPLAIKSIGSLLRAKSTIEEWESFSKKEFSRIGQNDRNSILPILKFSYDHLNSNLKQCFAYCSLFPKNHRIYKWDLIYLWMAQGYIKSDNESQTAEETGHSYFMDLVRRSFFQKVGEDIFGEHCKMHDLIHDLAQKVAGEESVMLTGSSYGVNVERHVSLGYDASTVGYDIEDPWEFGSAMIHNDCQLRSFLFIGRLYIPRNIVLGEELVNAKYLRALSLPNTEIGNVPTSIGELKHLRYLDISGNYFSSLPDSLTELLNLCMLNISNCEFLEMLPSDFRKLINLRRLKIGGCPKLEYIPTSIGDLKHLRYLDISYNPFKSLPDSLTKLLNLCTLNITSCTALETLPKDFRKLINLRHLKNRGCDGLKYMPPGFEELTSLQCLDEYKVGGGASKVQVLDGHRVLAGNLCISFEFDGTSDGWDEVECWQPPVNLQWLEIWNYNGTRIPKWGNGSADNHLSSLTGLVLLGCKRVECLPPFSHLPNLKSLIMERMDYLKYIQEEDGETEYDSFFLPPLLEKLVLMDLPKLKGWSGKVGAVNMDELEGHLLHSFTSLSYLQISRCPKLERMPLCPCLVHLLLHNNVDSKLISQLLLPSSPSITTSSLKYLQISDCFLLTSLSGESLTSLSTLDIELCWNLIYVVLAPSRFNVIEDLEIKYCPKLELWDEEKRGVDWDSLPNLRTLKLNEVPPLERLPSCLRDREASGKLEIRGDDDEVEYEEWV